MDIILTHVIPLILAAMGPAAIWMGKRVADWMQLDADAKTRDYLETAIVMGLAMAERRIQDYGGTIADHDFKGQIVRDAAEYIDRAVPDALEHFNIAPERLENMAEARLGVRMAEDNILADLILGMTEHDGDK